MVGRNQKEYVPKVLHRFEKKFRDGSVRKFVIQDVTPEMYEDIMDFMVENYLDDEPFAITAELSTKADNLKQIKRFWRYYVLPQNMSIVCFEDKENASEIIAVNYIIHAVKGQQERPKGNGEPESLAKIANEIYSKFDLFEKYEVEHYMEDYGLSVARKYRGYNIALEMLNARIPICKEMNIKMIETIFTVISSQTLAKKAGYETVYEITYEDITKALNMNFPKRTEPIRVMTKLL